MERKSTESELAFRLGARAGKVLFDKSKAEDVYDKLQKYLVDLWTGSGKHLEKADAAAERGEGDYQFEFTFDYDLTEADVKDNVPPDLAEAFEHKDAYVIKRTYNNPTSYLITLNLHYVRDRVYQALRATHRDKIKRKREEKDPFEGNLKDYHVKFKLNGEEHIGLVIEDQGDKYINIQEDGEDVPWRIKRDAVLAIPGVAQRPEPLRVEIPPPPEAPASSPAPSPSPKADTNIAPLPPAIVA